MGYFSLWFSWLSLFLNYSPLNETQQWLQLQGQCDFQHTFTSGKKYHSYCSDWNRYFESLMLRVNSVYKWPVSYITNRSRKEQNINVPSSPSYVPWQKRLKSASKPDSLHSIRQDVWHCHFCPLYGNWCCWPWALTLSPSPMNAIDGALPVW